MAVIVDTDSAGRVRRMYYEEDPMTLEERVDSICKWQNAGLRDLVIQEMRAAVEDEREDKKRSRDALAVYANKDHWHSHNGAWANVFDDDSAMDGWIIAESALEPETDREKRVVDVLRAENAWMRDRLAEANGQIAEANKRAEAWRYAILSDREAWASRADKEASATTPVDTYYAEGYRGAMRYMAHLLRSTTSPAYTEGEKE